MRTATLAIASALLLTNCLGLLDTRTAESKAAPASKQPALHRADFRVEGASCVSCLRRVAKAMRESKGVLKADISIYRPYWAIVIYDANTTKFDKLTAPIAKVEKVKFAEVDDKEISEMPLIVIPKMNRPPAQTASGNAAGHSH